MHRIDIKVGPLLLTVHTVVPHKFSSGAIRCISKEIIVDILVLKCRKAGGIDNGIYWRKQTSRQVVRTVMFTPNIMCSEQKK